MSFRAANLAGCSHLSPCMVLQAKSPSNTCNDCGDRRPYCGGHARSNRTAMAANFRSQSGDENFALKRVCRFVFRLMLGHGFGAIPAPGGTWSSASHCAPLWGLGSSQNKFAKYSRERPANFFRVPPRKQTFGTWEPGPLASFAPRDPSNNGRIQQTETLSCIRTK
jgi:hypothetical protein